MALDKASIARVAHLARIKVPDQDLDRFAREVSTILGFVEQLADVDTDGVEPMTSVVAMALPRREDKVTDGSQAEAVLRNAPEAAHGFFAVPKVVE